MHCTLAPQHVNAAPPGCMTVVAWPRGEGILPLFFRVEPDAQRPFGPRPPSNCGQDARDTQGRDALATGLPDDI
jgi:hypothetical protein